MKAKKGLLIRQIDDEFILVDSGEETPVFKGMIKLNEVSKSIVEKLIEKDMSIDELYDAMLSEYDVDRETLEKSVPPIIEQLKSVKIVK